MTASLSVCSLKLRKWPVFWMTELRWGSTRVAFVLKSYVSPDACSACVFFLIKIVIKNDARSRINKNSHLCNNTRATRAKQLWKKQKKHYKYSFLWFTHKKVFLYVEIKILILHLFLIEIVYIVDLCNGCVITAQQCCLLLVFKRLSLEKFFIALTGVQLHSNNSLNCVRWL